MNKKGFLEISFGWLFALLVGAFVLFLAIFLSIKIINVENTQQSAQLSKNIEVLLNPLETGFEEGSTSILNLGTETRIYNDCYDAGFFGKQTIRTSQKSFGKWTDTDVNVPSYNKYLFLENPAEGKEFYLFSKPFEFPFKVADLIYIIPTDKEYCFVKAPSDISKEISDLGLKNIITTTNVASCSESSEKVCFDSSGCDIIINTYEKSVKKQNKVYFLNNDLIYAAVFSDKETYECQLKRLMKRAEHLSAIYEQKASFVLQQNCRTNIDLTELNSLARSFNSSADLRAIGSVIDNINRRYEVEQCKLW